MSEKQNQFWQLLEPEYHGGRLFCRKLTGDRDAGDDLYQDALVIAYRKFSDLRDTSSFRPWFYRILVNNFKSTVRRPWWKRLVPLTSEIELHLTGENPVDTHTAKRWLERAFRAVSPEEQALVTLHELEGWTVGELADLYGKTEGAIKVRLFRARRRMKDALIRFTKKTKANQTTKSLLSRGKRCVAAKPNLD